MSEAAFRKCQVKVRAICTKTRCFVMSVTYRKTLGKRTLKEHYSQKNLSNSNASQCKIWPCMPNVDKADCMRNDNYKAINWGYCSQASGHL